MVAAVTRTNNLIVEGQSAAAFLKDNIRDLDMNKVKVIGREVLEQLAAKGGKLESIGITSPAGKAVGLYSVLSSGLRWLAESGLDEFHQIGVASQNLFEKLGFEKLGSIMKVEKARVKEVASKAEAEKIGYAISSFEEAARTSPERLSAVITNSREVLGEDALAELATEIVEKILVEARNEGQWSTRIINKFEPYQAADGTMNMDDRDQALIDIVQWLIDNAGATVTDKWKNIHSDDSRMYLAIRVFGNEFSPAERLEDILNSKLNALVA